MTSRRRDLILLSLMCVAAVACVPRPIVAPLKDHDLIVINIDSLRADHLGCYGYSRETSPFLDRLCGEAVVFERASAASSYTRESVAALLSGRLPSKSGALGWQAAPMAPHMTLAERLHTHGFRTALLSNTIMLKKPGFERGFETAAHLSRHWNLSGEGERLSDAAIDFVGRTTPERYFLYLHYLDPHAPYAPTEELRRRFAGAPPDAPVSLYDDVTPGLAPLRASGFGPGDPRFEDLVARYDAEIAATDAALERLFDGLARLGALDRALVVITSDHGEEFLEHGWVEHGWTLYEESLHVPLLFWAPGVLEPARVWARASHVDVVPSVLELLGVQREGNKVDGVPLFAIDAEGTRPRSDERVQIAELLLARRQIVRAVLLDDWKYLATWRTLDPSERPGTGNRSAAEAIDLWGTPVREEVYDLATDPQEQRNVVAMRGQIRDTLAAVIAKFRNTGPNYGFAAGTPDPPTLSRRDAERLRALGYGE